MIMKTEAEKTNSTIVATTATTITFVVLIVGLTLSVVSLVEAITVTGSTSVESSVWHGVSPEDWNILNPGLSHMDW